MLSQGVRSSTERRLPKGVGVRMLGREENAESIEGIRAKWFKVSSGSFSKYRDPHVGPKNTLIRIMETPKPYLNFGKPPSRDWAFLGRLFSYQDG